MAQIPRIVYFAQSGTIQTVSGAQTTYTLPISSAGIDVTRGIEGVNTFGHFGSLNTAQTNLTNCKSSIKGYMGSGSGINGFNAAFFNDILGNTQSGVNSVIGISSTTNEGFTMSGICDHIALDIAIGGFGMVDLGFAGLGEPVITNPLTAGSSTTALTNSFAISPITTVSISAGPNVNTQTTSGLLSGIVNALSGVYATSLKFAYDLPTDVLGSLGDNPDAIQGSSQIISQMATKPPYKATLSVEGYGVGVSFSALPDSSIANAVYVIGNIAIQLPHAKVSSRHTSNAAGQVSQTFSYSIEDFSATLTDASYLLGSYSQTPATLPVYGG